MYSFSQYDLFKHCPYAFERHYVSRDVPKRESEAMERGSRIHAGIEAYLLRQTDALPEEVHASWYDYLDELRNAPGLQPERRVSNDIAVGVIDAYVPARIVDFKTGKPKVHDLGKREQLRFYVWLLKESAVCTLAWVEHPRNRAEFTAEIEYTDALDRVWRTRLERLGSGPYEPNPSWFCRYCAVVDCPFNPAAADRTEAF